MVLVRFFRTFWIPLALIAAAAAIPWTSGDPRTRFLGLNTLMLSGAVCAISVAVGAPMAFLLVRTDLAGRRTATGLLALLLFVPLYLQAAAWQAGFAVQGWFTLLSGAPPLVDSWLGAIWIDVSAAIPWVVLIVGLGLWFVEPELEEEALLNASAVRVFRSVTCRRAWASAGAAALWVALATAGDMTITNLFQIRTYAEETYNQIQLGDNPTDFSWTSLSGILVIAWLTLAGMIVALRLAPREHEASQRRPWQFRLGRWRGPLGFLVWGVVLFLVGIPLGSLIYKGGLSHTRTADGWLHAWSLQKCIDVVLASPRRFRSEFGWSILIGSLAAAGAVLVALPLAWSARRGGVKAAPACIVTAVCLAIPGPMVGLLLIKFFNQGDSTILRFLYDQSIAAPCAAQLLRTLPLAILVLWHSLASVPSDLLDMAASEGAGRFTRFRRIAVASRRWALAAAWLVALGVALGEISATILVLAPGINTLAIEIFALIHYGVDDFVAGISLALVAGLAAVGGAALWLVDRGRR